MKKQNKKEEIQSRREFFKNAAKTALPIFGAIVAGSILRSCEPYAGTISCSDCSGRCDGCSDDCLSACTAACMHSCYFYGR